MKKRNAQEIVDQWNKDHKIGDSVTMEYPDGFPDIVYEIQHEAMIINDTPCLPISIIVTEYFELHEYGDEIILTYYGMIPTLP